MATRKAAAKTARKPYLRGWWADERVPDMRDLLDPLKVDPSVFAEWLGPRLGDYRLWVSWKADMPTRAQELAFLDELIRSVHEVEAQLHGSAMPPNVEASMVLVVLKHARANWYEMRDTVRDGLRTIEACLVGAKHHLSSHPVKQGRPTKHARDALIHDIATKLQALATSCRRSTKAMRLTAGQIAERCIGVDGAIADCARAVRRARKKSS